MAMAHSAKLLTLCLSHSVRSCRLSSSSLLPTSRHLSKPFPSLRYCSAAATEVEASPAPCAAGGSTHPWPEWDAFLEKLRTKGYFERPSPASRADADADGEAASATYAFSDQNRIKNACLKFARERFDLLSSLPKQDIQAVVQCGCPNLFRKSVSSAKRLRAFLRLDEGDVCSACKLRGSCDKAYVILNDEEAARTVDVVRILLNYAIDPTNLSGGSSISGVVQESARKLLSDLIALSDTTIDPSIPKPIFDSPSKKEPSKKIVEKARESVGKARGSIGKGVETTAAEMKMGDWLCPNCNFLNFARNQHCLECKADGPKKIPAASPEMKKGDWICPDCNFLNFARNRHCLECKADGPKKIPAASPEMKKGDWICPECRYMNFARNRVCFKCEKARPKRELNPGEWECPSCDFVNFARNKVCLKCNHDRPEDEDQDSHLGSHLWRKPKEAVGSRSFDYIDEEDVEDDVLPLEGERKFVVSRRAAPAQRRFTAARRQ